MPKSNTATLTRMATNQKIAVGFIVATASMVLVSTIVAGVITLISSRGTTTVSLQPAADRTFDTN